MVRTAPTGADVDRNGDVPGPSRLGRSSRQSRNAQMMGKHSSVFRGPVGADAAHSGALQQAGEAARLRLHGHARVGNGALEYQY